MLGSTSLARAQCTMDTECKGERICEGGKCVAPLAVSPLPAPAAAAEPMPRTTPTPAPMAAPANPPPAPEKPKLRRNSTGMMVGGIVMVSLSPVALFFAAIYGVAYATCSHDCEGYETAAQVSLLSATVLAGTGVPLIVVGARKVPVETGGATLTPWLAPRAAGLGLRLQL